MRRMSPDRTGIGKPRWRGQQWAQCPSGRQLREMLHLLQQLNLAVPHPWRVSASDTRRLNAPLPKLDALLPPALCYQCHQTLINTMTCSPMQIKHSCCPTAHSQLASCSGAAVSRKGRRCQGRPAGLAENEDGGAPQGRSWVANGP